MIGVDNQLQEQLRPQIRTHVHEQLNQLDEHFVQLIASGSVLVDPHQQIVALLDVQDVRLRRVLENRASEILISGPY
jgi:hypothetical protein